MGGAYWGSQKVVTCGSVSHDRKRHIKGGGAYIRVNELANYLIYLVCICIRVLTGCVNTCRSKHEESVGP